MIARLPKENSVFESELDVVFRMKTAADRSIGAQFGIHPTAVGKICLRKTWRQFNQSDRSESHRANADTT
jgi:hypothetical protein